LPVWKAFLIAFSVLLPLINPLGSALVFLGLVGDAPPKLLRSLARRIAINNIVFLAVFELAGATILNFFGISLPIVQLSGGMVVAAMGWGVLNERNTGAGSRNKEEETGQSHEPGVNEPRVNESGANQVPGAGKLANANHLPDTSHLEESAFYPFTFPITSGPGTLVALLTVTAHISDKNLTPNILAHLGVFLAIVALSILCYFCYAYAPKITKRISPSTAHGILRVIAFILLCIGVQIAWNGLSALIGTLIKP
jgi:multiple antibiotic resistance protein